MPNGYPSSAIGDIIKVTHQTFDKGRYTNLILGRQKLWAYELCENHAETSDGGSFYEFTVMNDAPDNTQAIGRYAQDNVTDRDINVKGRMDPALWYAAYSVEHTILDENQGEQQIIDYLRQKEEAMWTRHWDTFETWMFGHRTSDDLLKPKPFWYFMPVNHTGTAGDLTTPVGDFTGGNYYSGVNTANIDPSTNPYYKSYNKKYESVGEGDFVPKLFVAGQMCGFKNPVPIAGMPEDQPQYGYYTGITTLSELRTLSRNNNDNLGFDFMSPMPSYHGTPINWVPALDGFANMQPFMGIDWQWMKFRKNSRRWRKATTIPHKADEHNTSNHFYDYQGQLFCRNRRTQFVLAKTATYT